MSSHIATSSVSSDATDLTSRFVEALASVIGNQKVSLHEPEFSGNEWAYLKECLDSTFVSSVGEFVNRFESELADYTGAKHAVAVVNGTAALHVALQLAGVQAGDEVIVPALSFVATANAVAYCGAAPHFVDVSEKTLGMCPDTLREYLQQICVRRDGCCVNRITGRVVRAIVPMHTFGHPVELDALLQVVEEFGLVVVEDAAESLGSLYHEKHTGTFGLLGAVSFNGNKIITTGGGGAILTNDAGLARRAKHLTTTAKLPHRWAFEHDEIGYNYRMPNLNAALGCAQLEQLPQALASKRQLYARYAKALSDLSPSITLLAEPEGCRSNYWLQAALLDEPNASLSESLLAATNDAGYMTRPAWALLNRLRPYRTCPRSPLPVAESLERRIINLPSSAAIASGRGL